MDWTTEKERKALVEEIARILMNSLPPDEKKSLDEIRKSATTFENVIFQHSKSKDEYLITLRQRIASFQAMYNKKQQQQHQAQGIANQKPNTSNVNLATYPAAINSDKSPPQHFHLSEAEKARIMSLFERVKRNLPKVERLISICQKNGTDPELLSRYISVKESIVRQIESFNSNIFTFSVNGAEHAMNLFNKLCETYDKNAAASLEKSSLAPPSNTSKEYNNVPLSPNRPSGSPMMSSVKKDASAQVAQIQKILHGTKKALETMSSTGNSFSVFDSLKELALVSGDYIQNAEIDLFKDFDFTIGQVGGVKEKKPRKSSFSYREGLIEEELYLLRGIKGIENVERTFIPHLNVDQVTVHTASKKIIYHVLMGYPDEKDSLLLLDERGKLKNAGSISLISSIEKINLLT